MSTKRKRSGKGVVEGTAPLVNERLPLRLFATDRYPSNRNNCYSSLEFLLLVRDVLEGSAEMERLLCSCFGSLFRLPVRMCAFSAFIEISLSAARATTNNGRRCRQKERDQEKASLKVSDNPGTAPLVNERLPLRLFATDRYPSNRNNCYSSLEFLLLVRDVLEVGNEETVRDVACIWWGSEFGHVTGLACGEFEQGYKVDDKPKPKKADYVFWDKLFGGRRNLSLEDLAAMVAGDTTLSQGKKFRICLIIIVDGVLMPKTQKPKPTLKYVKLVEKLDKIFSFPWGRESFWWMISTMIPPKKVLGKCDDPEGDFFAQLRQESKFLLGFPLALQLWAFEAIPVLLDRLGGNDSVTLLSYVGDKLPTHTGLVLTDVLFAENNPKLTVLPMVEVDEDRDDGWGVFDCEILDRKVAYMVGLLKAGHKFQKGEWGGGDAAEPLYVHDPAATEVKRKIRKLTHKEEAGAVMKQRRLSRYFSRKGVDGGDKYEVLLGAVGEIKKELDRLNKVVEKQGRLLKKYKAKSIGKFSSNKGLRRRKKRVVSVDIGALFGGSDQEGNHNSLEELGVPGEFVDCGTEVDFGDLNRLVGVITREVAGEGAEKEGRKATGGGEHTKDIDGLSIKADVDATQGGKLMEGPNDKGGEALTCDEAIWGVRGKPKTDSSAVEEGDVNVEIRVERPPGAGVKEAKDGGMKGPIVDGLVADKDSLNCHNADEDATPAGQAVVEAGRVGERCGAEGEGTDTDGSGDEQVMELSDSSPCKRSEKQKPLEREAELAALLLAKEPFTMEKLVPTTEDTDFRFFENVLIGSPKVLHLNDGKFDLDNQFFIELTISQEWVSTKHMEALVEYVANRHEDRLKERRCIFLPPWFVAHLQGKARAFNAAKVNRGRVLGDGRLSGFLTKEGGKWGVDVETLYAPMIWDGNHWVGQCISLTDWRVLVLDPNPRLKDMAVVRGLLEVVSKMLPYLVEKVCPVPEDGPYGLEPFTVERMGGA
ncbi:hypothetical protein F2Q69_00021497 [Brassica cretica]|uniref:Ubiquitin-like protease family profile domain-containing protein n=1 Tax=Brassica cretica TaxID=69181 RepID=A0A8S9QQB6_BRACR|nr:hypothetical protein F2Q69_00021497 [Brassica cretica]